MLNQEKQLEIISYEGSDCKFCKAVAEIFRATLCLEGKLSLSIGQCQNRIVSVTINSKIHVSNVFQLSACAVSLLDLFLSILRDYDLTGNEFTSIEEIRGIVIIDEIDLHLHIDHQHKVLPKLMAMFSTVQFIVTSHSPLFVLGLQKTLGEEGFKLCELPLGVSILAENFAEFGVAYRVFSETH